MNGRPADTGDDPPADTVTVTVLTDDGERTLTAPMGATLRDVLLDAGHSPYTRYTERLNCGGRGICATCGVRIREGEADHAPGHWHDRLADRFGYPRLSCQVTLSGDLTVAVPEKLVWGGRETGSED
jgi:Na+-transporting NADH:ubiquinone oxidoreductase, subunit NqrF